MQGCAIQKGEHLVSEVVMVLLGILSLLLLLSKKWKQFISQIYAFNLPSHTDSDTLPFSRTEKMPSLSINEAAGIPMV